MAPGEARDFIAERAPKRIRPGVIVDESGRSVGVHDGIHRFTIGQRKGLGVAVGKPAFVAHIDADTATVHIGGEEALLSRGATLTDLSLAEGVSLPARARVRIRYRHDGETAVVVASPSGANVVFDEPVRAVTRGQIDGPLGRPGTYSTAKSAQQKGKNATRKTTHNGLLPQPATSYRAII